MLDQVKHLCKFAKFEPSDRPPSTFDCSCQMCSKYEESLIDSFVRRRNQHLMRKVKDRVRGDLKPQSSQDFIWVLKRLIPPSNKIVTRSVQFYIPQICFYKDAEPHCLFMTKQYNDYSLKQVPKDRLTSIYLQKTFNQRRRKYREKMMLAVRTPSPSISSIKKTNTASSAKPEPLKIDMSDAVIVRYIDGYEELIPESEFSMLINRRRQDSIWATIEHIKNYVPVQKETRDNVKIKFDKKAVDAELMQRAKTLIRVYAMNIIQGEDKYISDSEQAEFMDILTLEDKHKMFTYLSYKIICFLQTFHDVNIHRCLFDWKFDLLRHPVLSFVSRLQYQQLPKYDWTNQVAHQILHQQQLQTFYSKTLPTLNPKQKQISQSIEQLMDSQYDDVKHKCGISVKVVENSEEAENNKFWRKLHPECKVELSDGINAQANVEEFRRVYLGERKKRRALASEFKSNMVAIIHHLVPHRGKSRNQQITEGVSVDKKSNKPLFSRSLVEIKTKSPVKSTSAVSKSSRRIFKLQSTKATTKIGNSEHSTAFYDF